MLYWYIGCNMDIQYWNEYLYRIHQDSHHLLFINAEDPSQCTYLRNLKKKHWIVLVWYGTWGKTRYICLPYTSNNTRFKLPYIRPKWALDIKPVHVRGQILPKLKKEKISRNYFFLELYVTRFRLPPPLPLCGQIFTSFCSRLCQQHKKILRFVQLS
jgi:hypothetical protein